ncbi:MAG: IS3 family transposase [bacterium]
MPNRCRKNRVFRSHRSIFKGRKRFFSPIKKTEKRIKLRPYQKFSIIKKLGLNISILCDISQVSKSGYYRWLKTSVNQSKDYTDYLLIKDVFEQGKNKYGWRSIQMNLRVHMNHKKIIGIMNKYGLCCKIRKRNPYKSMAKATQEHQTFDNLLNRQFVQYVPYKFFSTDITYLKYNNRLAYLSVIKDIATGEIVSHELSYHLTMDIVLNTIEKMKYNLGLDILKKALIHSDQGFHYTNPLYIKIIKDLEMIQSMSRKGNCIDNCVIESFFGHLKDDTDYRSCKTFEQLQIMIDNYINHYNNKRFQWSLKKMTPVEYRNHLLLV